MHWLEISRSALLSNLRLYRSRISPHTRLMSVVKANAYGHGLKQVAPVVAPHSDFLMVNTFEEALEIRRLKIPTKILVAAPILPSDLASALTHRVSLCAHSLEYLKILSCTDLPLKLHLKINTGTNRLGISNTDTVPALTIFRQSKLIPEGIYTHFHSSDTGSSQSQVQLRHFLQAVSQFKNVYPEIISHCSSSSSSLLWPKMHLDMIRLGISLYGLWPDPYVKKHAPGLNLKPVLSWKCRPVQYRKINAGETVGYSATHTYVKPGLMAVLPIGYSDGYDRKLSNRGRVWYQGRYCPVIGRVAMNFTITDITGTKHPLFRMPPNNYHSPSSMTTELIGPHITADEIARLSGTINYEVVSRLNPLIPRIIVK